MIGNHVNRLPTVRIDLGDGDFVELHKYLLVKTQRAIAEYCLAHVQLGQTPTAEALKGHEKEIVEIFFVNQALELSIGVIVQKPRRFLPCMTKRRLVRMRFTPPFDYASVLAALDDVGFDKLQIIEVEMNRLYSQDPFQPKSDAA